MTDLAHVMGNDLTLSATGDLLIANGADATQQRVLRRLLTNPTALVFHQAYGAGLAQFVGQPASADRIKGVIAAQMQRERGVGASPPPTVDVTAGVDGTVVATVRYADQATGLPSSVSLTP